ncbi:hypothetical protein EOD42_22340 [Rhodovarius crocodyli]|uniref:Uncharacterized protein n=1 Tax=Rhodovarius crocodyli TaxID=1979269 RepID=A0A437M131_9PROT|nr:hypothetical protein [Rhodovarius crocodyli]RVT91397.1 hypothetical protein EOD42_22340 [Rhodovarius crocodyli]
MGDPVLEAGRRPVLRALLRCYECAEDGQDTDVGRDMLGKLVAAGWLTKDGRNRWQFTIAGQAIVTAIDAIPGMRDVVEERAVVLPIGSKTPVADMLEACAREGRVVPPGTYHPERDLNLHGATLIGSGPGRSVIRFFPPFEDWGGNLG